MSAGIAANRKVKEFSVIAEKAACLWGLTGPIKFLRESENIVYEIDGYILRLTEDRHRTAMELNAEVHFISTLFDKGVSVATPYLSSNGLYIETVEGFHFTVFKKATGVEKSINKAFLSLDVARNLGRELGKIHTISVGYSPRGYKRHHATDIVYQKEGLKFILADDHLAVEEFKKAMCWVKSLPKNSDVYGMIHMDAHTGNFFIDDNDRITLFDFDDCAYNFFAYDLATPLSRLLLSRLSNEQKQDIRAALLQGYAEEYTLRDEWLAMIDGFIRFRFIEMFAWRCMMFGVPKDKAGRTVDYVTYYKLAEDFAKPYPRRLSEN